MKLRATAEQCKKALAIASARSNGQKFSTREASWYLLEVLGYAPSQDDPESDGLEPDNGSETSDGKAYRIFTEGLDWQATFILNRYVETQKAALAVGKRLKPNVVLGTRGIVGKE